MKSIIILIFSLCCMLGDRAAAAGSVEPFLIMFGNKPKFTKHDLRLLAGYNLLIFDRFRFKQIGGNTWRAIKNASPNTKIFLYQAGPLVADNQDSHSTYYINNLGRFNKSRGSIDGSLNQDHPEWFLKNIFGNRVPLINYAGYYYLDFGNAKFVDYWVKHTLNDISFQEWRADGIFVDEATVCHENKLKTLAGYVPAKYSSCEDWDENMNAYLARASAAIHKQNQLFAANRGHSRYAAGTKAWLDLDKIKSPLDFVLEEGAFATHWGDSDVQFLPVEQWKRQIDLPAKIQHSAVGMLSHTDLAPNQTGFTADGKRVSYDQVLRFAVGSYLLAKNIDGPTTYFFFNGNRDVDGYKKLVPTQLYSKYDIGAPVEKYKKMRGKNIYFRNYSGGYVYVNPSSKTISNIQLAPDFRPRSDTKNVTKEDSSWFLTLKPHDAAIVERAAKSAAKPAAKPALPASPKFDLQ